MPFKRKSVLNDSILDEPKSILDVIEHFEKLNEVIGIGKERSSRVSKIEGEKIENNIITKVDYYKINNNIDNIAVKINVLNNYYVKEPIIPNAPEFNIIFDENKKSYLSNKVKQKYQKRINKLREELEQLLFNYKSDLQNFKKK